MSKWNITLPVTARGESTRIVKDGEDITNQVRSITIHSSVHDATTVEVEYIRTEAEIEAVTE